MVWIDGYRLGGSERALVTPLHKLQATPRSQSDKTRWTDEYAKDPAYPVFVARLERFGGP